ncbi:MAG TPA: AAA family ATPase, partial [Nocardioides sp.]
MNTDEWRQVQELHAGGESIRGIAARLGMSRNTVRRALATDTAPTDRRATRGSYFEDHAEEIRRALRAHPTASVPQLAEKLDWPLSESALAKYVARVRRADGPADSMAASDDAPARAAARMPRYATGFVGRRDEVAQIRTLLGEHRLVTLTGIGGVGKTRLAAEVAEQVRRAYIDGVRFVELASLRSPALLAETVLDALGIAGRDQPGATAESALVDFLGDRHLLLVLDNCEHIVEACATLVHTLLHQAPGLSIVVTSREILAVPDEFVLPLRPLPVASRDGGDSPDSAVALFVARAAAVLGGFTLDDGNREAVHRVCARLDGLPLAIELACARLPVLSVSELADRLGHRMDLLTTGNRGAPERHRSLSAALDWSHDHCSPEQRLLWSRAAVFVDGFDLTMAERVCGDADLPSGEILDAIAALVGKSILVREDHGDGVRFRMLETVREFGQAKLSPAETTVLQRRLLDWLRATLTKVVRGWHGPDEVAAIARIRANRSNLRVALQAALDGAGDDGIYVAADAVADPWFLWAGGMSIREHRLWLTRIADALPPSHTRGRVRVTLALVQTLQGDRRTALASVAEARTLAARFDDAATDDFAVHTEGLAHYFAGDFTESERMLEEALRRYDARPPRGGLRAALEVHLGMHYSFHGRLDRAAHHFGVAHAMSARVDERWFRAYADFGLGLVALLEEDGERARDHARDGLGLIRAFGDVVGTTLITDLLGWAEAVSGDAERAAVLLGSASTLWGSVGHQLYGSDHWVEMRERYAAVARVRLGADAYRERSEHGAAMPA